MKKLLLSSLLSLPFASQAMADGLRVCNDTPETLFVAFANYENSIWSSHGWYTVQKDACAPLTKYFTNGYYYLYAYTASGQTWGDSRFPFCTSPKTGRFDIRNANDIRGCETRGYMQVNILDRYTGMYPSQYELHINGQGGDSVIH